MFDVILSIVLSFLITYVSIPVIIRIAEQKKLFDIPDERKLHKQAIASLGGFGIFAGFALASLVTISFSSLVGFQYFIAAAFIIFFLGLKDDILVISPIKKFFGQVVATVLVIYKGEVLISNMHGVLGVNELPEMFSWILTMFTILVVINAFNLIDGVDGLAGSLGLMTIGVLGVYFAAAGDVGYAALSFAMAGSLSAFLIFNYSPAKIFMGDTGSLLIGLVTAILVIHFINVAPLSMKVPLRASPALGFSLVIIPLLDTLRVFGIRMLHRRSPFSPDRNHIHHLLLDNGLSHKSVTGCLVVANIIFIALSYAASSVGSTWLIVLMSVAFFVGVGVVSMASAKPRIAVSKLTSKRYTGVPSRNIVLLKSDTVLQEN